MADGDAAGLSREWVAEFETLQSQVDGLYDEVRALAGKHPNDALNKFKLGVVNGLLRRTNRLLGERVPLEGFEEFSDEAMPTNSDVLVVLSQYLAFLEKVRSDNISNERGYWFWVVNGKLSEIRTTMPRKLGK